MTNFKVFYQNIRELKSKVDSIMETISDFQPILTWLVETHLQKEDELGYQGLVRYSTMIDQEYWRHYVSSERKHKKQLH